MGQGCQADTRGAKRDRNEGSGEAVGDRRELTGSSFNIPADIDGKQLGVCKHLVCLDGGHPASP